MIVKITEEEIKELVELTRTAETTPVIALSLKDGLEGRDWSTQAWNRVRDKWNELGKKYGFNPSDIRGIKSDTGEILI